MDNSPIRVALLSFWHSHATRSEQVQFTGDGVFGTIAQHPEIDVVAAWDDVPERGRVGAAVLGVPFADDLEALLTREDIDGVVVLNETTGHGALCRLAAQHGKHIYVTKVLTPTRREAEEVIAACDEAGVVVVTMLSRLYEPWAITIRDLVQSGRIGTVFSMKIWHSHGQAIKPGLDGAGYLPDGHGFLRRADGGGGAYIDMCHPQYLTPYILGSAPDQVFARMSSVSGRGDVEDNAVVLLDYSGGPYVVLEESWASAPTTTYVEVQGTNGTVVYRDDKTDADRVALEVRSGDQLTFERLDVPTATDSPLDEWIRCVRSGTRPDENIARSLELSLMNEAAYTSAERGVSVQLSSLVNS